MEGVCSCKTGTTSSFSLLPFVAPPSFHRWGSPSLTMAELDWPSLQPSHPSQRQSSLTPCSLGLSATSQHNFSLRTNQPPATSQQYPSLRTNQHQPSATSQPNRLLVDPHVKRGRALPLEQPKQGGRRLKTRRGYH
jgi:hypothetical protein